MLDVLTLSPFIAYPNVYFTCRRMYALWPATRDTVVNHMLLSHQPDYTAHHGLRFGYQWGNTPIRILNYGGSMRGTCRLRWLGARCPMMCKRRPCNVYITCEYASNGGLWVTYCYKTDIINGISFCVKAYTDFPKLITQLQGSSMDDLTIHVGPDMTCFDSAEVCAWWYQSFDVSRFSDTFGGTSVTLTRRVLDYMMSSAVDSVAYLGADFRGLV